MVKSYPWRTRSTGLAAALILLLAFVPAPAHAQGIGLAQLMKITDWGTESLVLFDQFEYAPVTEGGPVGADIVGWYGGAFSRLWLDAEVEQETESSAGEGEFTLAYGRLVTPYFDALIGGKVDAEWEDDLHSRIHLAVGLEGVAPLRFELSPMLYITRSGQISGEVTAEYSLLITQKLVFTPRAEVTAAIQAVPEWGIGSGLNQVESGVRLRYEFVREFAPYLGVSWNRTFAETAKMAAARGEERESARWFVGLRFWR